MDHFFYSVVQVHTTINQKEKPKKEEKYCRKIQIVHGFVSPFPNNCEREYNDTTARRICPVFFTKFYIAFCLFQQTIFLRFALPGFPSTPPPRIYRWNCKSDTSPRYLLRPESFDPAPRSE